MSILIQCSFNSDKPRTIFDKMSLRTHQTARLVVLPVSWMKEVALQPHMQSPLF